MRTRCYNSKRNVPVRLPQHPAAIKPKTVIIGAGAAGLMAAIHAATPSRRVVLLERTADGGRKILISGGGRCNVLPAELDERRFISASSPATLRNILRSWPLPGQRDFFEKALGLPLVEEEATGKLFPAANSARMVRDALVRRASDCGVEFITGTSVTAIAPTSRGWTLSTEHGSDIAADRIILATGGLSVPATGSDGFGLKILAELRHTINTTYPALTPITLAPSLFADLAGVSLTATLTAMAGAERRTATGGFLFTHRGYSGPAMLDVSDVLVRSRIAGAPGTLRVRWTAADEASWQRRLAPSAARVGSVVRSELPTRLADRLMRLSDVEPSTSLAQLPRGARLSLIENLVRFELPWSGDEGYKKAEVTGGGLSLAEVDPRTLESRLHPGLFVAGEVLDAFGPIGGYNFAWAWATGKLAGLASGASP